MLNYESASADEFSRGTGIHVLQIILGVLNSLPLHEV
jgi:hypothetical protein